MQVVGAVVLRQGVFGVADLELAAGDPVGDPSGGGPEIGVPGEVAVKGIEAKHHVLELSIAPGNMQLSQEGSVGHDTGLDAVLVHHRVDLDSVAIRGLPEGSRGELGGRHRTGSQQKDAGNETEDPDELHGNAP